MSDIGWGKHALILAALVINLWVGGDLVEAWLGHGWRAAFEIVLIFGWMTLVVGMRVPLPWRRPRDDREARERPPGRDRQ